MGKVTFLSDGTDVGEIMSALNELHANGVLDAIAGVVVSGSNTARVLGGTAPLGPLAGEVGALWMVVTQDKLDGEDVGESEGAA